MWTKDAYQEQMMGYLGGVLTEIERLEHSRIRQNDLIELYDDLEIALKRLWHIVEASDVDWEGFRYSLEASCDELLRAFYGVSYVGSLIHPVTLTLTENHEKRSQAWIPAEMLG